MTYPKSFQNVSPSVAIQPAAQKRFLLVPIISVFQKMSIAHLQNWRRGVMIEKKEADRHEKESPSLLERGGIPPCTQESDGIEKRPHPAGSVHGLCG